MRKIALILYLLPLIIFSQDQLSFGKGKFYRGSQLITVKDFVLEMKSSPEAFELANSARPGYSTSNVLGLVGGFLIGWPIGTAIGGGEPDWGVAVGGAAILAIAIPLAISSTKKLKEASQIYNGVQTTTSRSRLDLNISPSKTGLTFYF